MSFSTYSTSSLEEMNAAAPGAMKIHQLYVFRSRDLTAQLVRRAEEHGCAMIALTVDNARPGKRELDVPSRGNFVLPSHLDFKVSALHCSQRTHARPCCQRHYHRQHHHRPSIITAAFYSATPSSRLPPTILCCRCCDFTIASIVFPEHYSCLLSRCYCPLNCEDRGIFARRFHGAAVESRPRQQPRRRCDVFAGHVNMDGYCMAEDRHEIAHFPQRRGLARRC